MATMPSGRFTERVEERTIVNMGTRAVVSWGGVLAGLFVAAGVVLLLTVLGVAVGIAVLPDARAAGAEGTARLGIGAGVWAALSLLVGFFVGGLVSARATNHPDRAGAVIQGTLVWGLGIASVVVLVMSGISASVTDLFQGLGLLTRGALVSSVATATGASTDEASRALDDLRARIAPLRDDPARVATEVHTFFAELAERAKPQDLNATAPRPARFASWITLGALLLTLLVSIGGALTGTPDADEWRSSYD